MTTESTTSPIEQLYRKQGGHLWLSLLAFSGDPEVASDSVAEAFAQLLGRGDAVRSPERWVWRAAFRIAAGTLKARRRSLPASPEVSYVMEEPARDLVAALARLSPRQRAAVVLHHAADYPIKEVAAILGTSQAAVKVHLARGRARLRDLLGDDDDG